MKRDKWQIGRVACLALCFLRIILPSVCHAEQLDEKTRSILDTIIKGQQENRSRIADMTMHSESKETISADDGEVRAFYHSEVDYYQLGEKERTDSKHFEDSTVEDLQKNHMSKWVYTGERILSHLEGTTLCSVGFAANRMNLRTQILDNDICTPSFATFMEEIRHYLDRYDAAKDQIKVETIQREAGKLIQVLYLTTRGGKGRRALVIDPSRGYEVVSTASQVHLRDGRLWIDEATQYDVAEVAPNAWRPIGCQYQGKQLNTQENRWVHGKKVFKTLSYEANTGKIDDSYFTFEGMGVPPGTPVADLTFDPPIEYNYKSAPFSDVDLEAVWSQAESPNETPPSDMNATNPSQAEKSSSQDTTEQITPASEDDDDASVPGSAISSFVIRIAVPATACLMLGVVAGYLAKSHKSKKQNGAGNTSGP